MRPLTVGVLASVGMVVLALTGVTASAFLLENLPEKDGRAYVGKSAGVSLIETVGGVAFDCTSMSLAATEETSKPPLGSYHLSMRGCVSSKPIKGLKCTGMGDSSGTILESGTWQLVFDKDPAATRLVTAMLFTVAPLSFECGAGAWLFEVKGSWMCLHKNPTVSTRTHEYDCVQTSGSPEETRWWSSTGTEEAALLLSSLNGSAYEQMALAANGVVEATEAIQADQ